MVTSTPLQNIEKILRIKLNEIESINAFQPGYVISNTTITGLSLYSCKINDLKKVILELGDLDLKYLNLRYTEISNISSLRDLSNLVYLDLRGNAISDVSSLKELKNLSRLNLRFNRVEDIAPLKDLQLIALLDLRNNQIETLPSWIMDFKGDIHFDNINDTFEESKSINSIYLAENPLKSPSPEIIKQGHEYIRRYFQRIEGEGLDYIYEAKLILVGEGNSGKTSLQLRLRDKNAKLPDSDTRTRGIKVEDWIFKETSGNKHIAHIWDFGGQDVYYPVHRFFLTENSVFVLLASTRQTHHNFDYWIPTIYQFGGSSPIIIGQTRHEGNTASWNELGYYLGNPIFNIIKTKAVPYYELNLPSHNSGLSEIEAVIIDQLTCLQHYGKGVPKSWVLVRDKIFEEIRKCQYISFEKFGELCKQLSPDTFSNSISVQDCAIFLHTIGVILWYSNSEILKDWVVLQPEWAMNAVYRIIDDTEIQQNNGNITNEDLNRLWTGTYEGQHTILKKMLQEFKIAFPKKHQKGDYILPIRLPSIPLSKKWTGGDPVIKIEYHYDFMPKGIVNQLSAELSRFISKESEIWNNAVNFSDDINRSHCQVEEDFFYRKITLKGRGKDARGLLLTIMGVIADITEEYKGVKPRITVPCRCDTCKSSDNPTRFLYDDLIKWSTKKTSVFCNEGDTSLIIEDLLRDIGLVQPQVSSNRIIKIFLASSSELESDRREFETLVNRENKRLIQENIFIELIVWEDFIDAMSQSRLQDEYNKAIRESDIFISLFFSKVGMYTKEEFDQAYQQFKKTNKPFIYTYFKNAPINMNEINDLDFLSKIDFQNHLKSLGHFPTVYNDINDLKYQFDAQLDKLIPKILLQLS